MIEANREGVDALGANPRFGRRTAFKAAFVAAGAIIVGREVETFVEGTIDTPSGLFYPIYEHHDQFLKEQDIPDDLDAFFRELKMDEGDWRRDGADLLNTQILIPNKLRGYNTLKGIIDFPILKKLAQNSTKIVFGDTHIPADIVEKSFDSEFARMCAGGIVAVAGTSYLLSQPVINRLEGTEPSTQELGRRKFIGVATLGTTMALEAPLISILISHVKSTTYLEYQKGNIVQRILQRMGNLVGNLNPEDHIRFFRSLVMANKLLLISEAIQRQTDRKAKVGFNVGDDHSDIEDFLQAGHDFTRFLISRYSNDFLQAIAETNGSIENFCSARAINLIPDINFEDLEKPDILRGRPVKYEEKFRDLPLIETLNSRLAA